MKLNHQTVLQQTQKLVITPELRQSIEILQYTSAELTQHIQSEMLDNPLLEAEDSFEEMANLILQNEVKNPSATMSAKEDAWSSDHDIASVDSYTEKKQTLIEYLKAQLSLAELPQHMKNLASYIIEMVSPSGYLDLDMSQLSHIYGLEISEIESVISALQQFEPVGVFARSLSECLVIQLKVKQPYNILAIDLAEHHLEYIASSRLSELVDIYDCDLDAIQQAIDLIKSLNPKPGLQFSGNQPVNYIMADVEVKRDGDGYIILVSESSAPRLHISSYYKQVLQQPTATKDTKHYLNQKIARALRLIRSIEQRRSTMYNVTDSIIKFQPEFFDGQVDYLNPLRLKDIATDIHVHESTISRAINGKYVQTPMGVFAFKYFLQSGVRQPFGNSVSAENIKHIIRTLIQGENVRKPLSDQKIANKITKDTNIVVSRRTVAKYREAINIPSSLKRRRY